MPGRASISVLGAGLMGHGIAYVFAAAGHRVALHDPNAEALRAAPSRLQAIAEALGDDAGALENVGLIDDLADAVADAALVIEAAPEKPDLKRALFADLDRLAPADAVLASNTSVIPISEIARDATRRHRILGTHFWNPPHFVPLVEVVQADDTDPECIGWTMELLAGAGMSPVHVRKDVPGFIGNRLQHALKREAIALVAAGVCDAKTLDFVVREGFGARLGVLGPLEQSDMIGLGLTLDIHEVLMPHLDVTPQAHPLLREKVTKGETGMAAGRGFADWTPDEAEAVRRRFAEFMSGRARAIRAARHGRLQTADS
jgi:3-hydroxybutyryl-CoA dehydrogenase